MTDAQRIRDWLRDRPEGASAPEIARGAGASIFAVYQLHSDGMLARDGGQRRYSYRLVREPVPAMDNDVRRVRRREQERARRRRNGARPLDEHHALVRAEAVRRAAERPARAKATKVAKPLPLPKPKPAKPAKPKPMPIAIEPKRPARHEAPKPAPRRQTVDEFVARGGVIERIPPPWEVRAPLRHDLY